MAVAVKPETITTPPKQLEGEEELLLTGSEAIAHALRLADVDIVAAYPIRPYDAVMQAVAQMIANGQMDCEYIVAEGEHSQFEIVKHASAVGDHRRVESLLAGLDPGHEQAQVTHSQRVVVLDAERARVVERAVADVRDHRQPQTSSHGDGFGAGEQQLLFSLDLARGRGDDRG